MGLCDDCPRRDTCTEPCERLQAMLDSPEKGRIAGAISPAKREEVGLLLEKAPSLPARMHAIVIDEQSENRDLIWTEVDRPEPGPGEVLIKVAATAVNRADMVQRAGRYNPPPGASTIMGLEAAGTIAALGEGVNATKHRVGDRVACLLTGGGYAEYVAAPAALLLDIPDEVDFERAAAFPEVFATAWVNLFQEGELKAGETLLLHAAASGVGCAAIQLAQRAGARVIASCSGDKHDFLRETFGVEALIDRHTQDFSEVARALTDGAGVDVILDPVGGANLPANIQSLARCGRLVNIGLLSGREGQLNMGLLLVKRLRVIGSVLRARSVEEKTPLIQALRDDAWAAYCAGELSASRGHGPHLLNSVTEKHKAPRRSGALPPWTRSHMGSKRSLSDSRCQAWLRMNSGAPSSPP